MSFQALSLLNQQVCHRLGYGREYLGRQATGPTRTSGAAPAGDELSDDGGFTLLETVVSFLLFTIVAVGAAVAIVSALRISHTSQQRVDAANAAQGWLSTVLVRYHGQSDQRTIPRPNPTIPAAVRNESFVINQQVTPASGACPSSGSFTVTLIVNQAQSAKQLARTDTVIACTP